MEGQHYLFSERVKQFLLTHPVPIAIANLVNAVFSQGMHIPAADSKLARDIRESLADMTSV